MRDIIKNLILEFHKEDLPDLFIKRDIEIPKLPNTIRKAIIFIGMKKSWKNLFDVSTYEKFDEAWN